MKSPFTTLNLRTFIAMACGLWTLLSGSNALSQSSKHSLRIVKDKALYCCSAQYESCEFSCASKEVCAPNCPEVTACLKPCLKKYCLKNSKVCLPKKSNYVPPLNAPSEYRDPSASPKLPDGKKIRYDGKLTGNGPVVYNIENWSDEVIPLTVVGVIFGTDLDTKEVDILKKSLPINIRARDVKRFEVNVHPRDFILWKKYYKNLTVGIMVQDPERQPFWKYKNLLTPQDGKRVDSQLVKGAFEFTR